MTTEERTALDIFINATRLQVEHTLSGIDYDGLDRAKDIIQEAENNRGRVHITGIGKPGHLAEYLASLLSSTGTPTYFLHGTEAVHGSSGQLMEGDVVIGISNSGNTEELMATMRCAQMNGCKTIGITGNPDSLLAKESDAALIADVVKEGEGGPLNRAPRNSILAEMLMLQYLSVLLQQDAHVTPEQYVMHHPHGALGKLREDEVAAG